MATIVRRPSGLYQAQVCINGIRKAKSFQRAADAKRWAASFSLSVEDGAHPDAALPLRHFIEEHAAHIGAAHKHPRHEKAVLGYLLDDPLADIKAGDVTSRDIDAWIDRRRTIPSRTTGVLVKESTIARQKQVISSMFAGLVRRGIIKENPCSGSEKVSDALPRERTASDEDIERLKIVARWEEGQAPLTKMQRVCAAFVLSCLTGMRAGEMMRIERTWIHGKAIRLPAEATKTTTARTIILCDRAKRILDDVCQLGFEPTIWDLEDGTRDALWRKMRDQADLRNVYDSHGRLIKQGLTFHDGRATFCTWAASPGPDGAPRMDVMSLSRQTGHKNLKMLMHYYRPRMEDFIERLNK